MNMLWIILLFSFTKQHALYGTIQAKGNENELYYVNIEVSCGESKTITAPSDEVGFFYITPILGDTCVVTIQHVGFEKFIDTIYFFETNELRLDIQLIPQE